MTVPYTFANTPGGASIPLTHLDADFSYLEGEISTISGDIATINGEITTINGEITTINGEITTINGEITTINGEIATINANLPLKAVLNIATLRATAFSTTYSILLQGYYNNADGGGGYFKPVTGSPGTYTDNGGTVIIPTGGNGSQAWIRSGYNLFVSNTINVRWFGALGDGTDQTTSMQNAITAANTNVTIIFPQGSYFVSAQINCGVNLTILGAGPNQSLIWRTGNYGNTFYFDNAGALTISGFWFWHGLPYNSYETSSYTANTSATSGYPGDGKIIWNNATQTSSTNILISSKTSSGSANQYLSLIYNTQQFLIKDSSNENNYQKWTVTGAPTNINPGSATSYWSIPVTLAYSGGTGTSGFTNSQAIDLQTGALPNRATTGSHLYFNNGQNITIDNCWFWRMVYNIYINQASIVRITRCNMQGAWSRWNTNGQEQVASIAIGPNFYTQLVNISDCYFGGADAGNQKVSYPTSKGTNEKIYLHNDGGGQFGILVGYCEGLGISNCYLGGNAYSNIIFNTRGITSQVKIHNNFFDGAGTDGGCVLFSPAVDGNYPSMVVFSANTFNVEIYSLYAITSYNPYGTQPTATDITMTGNIFGNSVATPLLIRRFNGATIVGNNFTGYNASNYGAIGDTTYSSAIYVDNSNSFYISNNSFGGGVNSAYPSDYCYLGYTDGGGNYNVTVSNNFANGLASTGDNIGRIDNGTYVITSGSYVMTGNEQVIINNLTVSASNQIALPAKMYNGYTVTIKDGKGDCSSYPIGVIGTINNATNYVMSTNYQSLTLMSYNGAWLTI